MRFYDFMLEFNFKHIFLSLIYPIRIISFSVLKCLNKHKEGEVSGSQIVI